MIEPRTLQPRSRRMLSAAAGVLLGLAAMIPLQPVNAISGQSEDRTSYVLFSQDSRNVTMSGSTEDIERARALRSGREALLYVRQGGAAYVIRDPATLRRARLIFQPQEALGARQAELGSRQAALGGLQAQLGAQQARLGARQASASPGQVAELGRQQAVLGRRQDELGRRQNALGTQQSALGREQARLSREADSKFRALLADAMRSGVARRVN